MLDDVFLAEVNEIVRASSNIGQASNELTDLLHVQVSLEMLVFQLLLSYLPELIVLQLHD